MTFAVSKRILTLGPERPLPPKPKMAINAAKAIARNVAAIARGESLFVSRATAEQRMAICETCADFRPSDKRCANPACGCCLKSNLISKTSLKAERCPANKW